MILTFLLLMTILSSSNIFVEGKQQISKNVELKWKVEVLRMIKNMTMILQMDCSAPGICS